MNRAVTESALVRRINRKLARQPWPQRMHVLSENRRGFGDLGRFYLVDHNNIVTYKHADLEGWARELGVLAATESLAV